MDIRSKNDYENIRQDMWVLKSFLKRANNRSDVTSDSQILSTKATTNANRLSLAVDRRVREAVDAEDDEESSQTRAAT
jgi:hypothetical protein